MGQRHQHGKHLLIGWFCVSHEALKGCLAGHDSCVAHCVDSVVRWHDDVHGQHVQYMQ
jgi:hypothetical protein